MHTTIYTILTSLMKRNTVLGCIIFSTLTMSCEETVRLDLKQTPSKIVIEGLVTNKPGYQNVKVSRSVSFYGTGKTPRITNAIVSVSDDEGNVFPFVHNPRAHADSAGYYLPALPFTGTIGRTYSLKVEADNEVYEAIDKLAQVTPMDSLNYELDADEAKDPQDKGKVYSVLLFTQEPQDETNYYLFKFYRNDSLLYQNDTDVYYSDDQVLAENINGIASPIFYAAGDVGKVEMFSLSRMGYIYYNDLSIFLNTDSGGMFGSVPANPRGNISNDALGFFQVSAVDISSVLVK